MNTVFHLSFVIVFLSFTAIRAYFHKKAVQSRGPVEYKEGRLHTALRLIIGIPFMLALLIYMVRPGWFTWAALPLQGWGQWAGLILGTTSIPLILWVQVALGNNFSTTLHVRQEHTLVTQGPYRWVRHPMYTVLFVHLVALLLLSANWFIGGVPLLAFTLIVAARLKNEEHLMAEKFGPAYQDYMRRTGRFLPRLKGIGI
jgi:protein-S-isoprenylcysteine O-methyltransferase Ste14